jgi:hypothetical protein
MDVMASNLLVPRITRYISGGNLRLSVPKRQEVSSVPTSTYGSPLTFNCGS